jgi:hypothetical protein
MTSLVSVLIFVMGARWVLPRLPTSGALALQNESNTE